ncbi:MAG: S8 family serine peptidase [Woeseiaceae bacterium]|nr:S8 family serine peptidase [Woeseiaceae bacterium]
MTSRRLLAVLLTLLLGAGATVAQDREAVGEIEPPERGEARFVQLPIEPVLGEYIQGLSRLRFVWPDPRREIALGRWQLVAVKIGGNGDPTSYRVGFDTTSDTLDIAEWNVPFDEDGNAYTFVRSDREHDARLYASAGDETISVELMFRNIGESSASIVSFDEELPLQIHDDLVGIQLAGNATESDIEQIAARLGLPVERSYYRGLFFLRLRDSHSLESIRLLGHFIAAEYSETVKNTGLAVSLQGSDSLWIMTDNILFMRGAGSPSISTIAEQYQLASHERIAGCDGMFAARLSILSRSRSDQVAEAMLRDPNFGIRLAQPDFVRRLLPHATADQTGAEPYPCPPDENTDPRLCEQWHHRNDAVASHAIEDADIDSAEAWRISDGSTSEPLIAIIDSGFSNNHPDYRGNLWTERGEVGRDFADDDQSSLLDDPAYPKGHGTAVAGIVGAEVGNRLMGSGVCPGCKLMLLRHDGDSRAGTEAICFARSRGARVINNSWGADLSDPMIIEAISQATADEISVVFSAMTLADMNKCGSNDDAYLDGDLASLDNVIAVSASNIADLRSSSGFGNCIDVLAPTARDGPFDGIGTTWIERDEGAETVSNKFNTNFFGTSAAAPTVTGTIGLMLDRAPGLTRIQIQRVLQDTADRISPDKYGGYDPEFGFNLSRDSDPNYAYGRINAFEAVRLVAPRDGRETDPRYLGREGRDLLIRDHEYDWGNTEQNSSVRFTSPRTTISVLNSVDIRIGASETSDSAPDAFLDVTHESYEPGEPATIYVRVRNRGPHKVDSAEVLLFWTLAAGDLPALPATFWEEFPDHRPAPPDPDAWNALDGFTLHGITYSGPSIAGCPERPEPACLPVIDNVRPTDTAMTARFELPAISVNGDQRLALLAIAHSEQADPALGKLASTGDLLDPLYVVMNDNNAALWVEPVTCSDSSVSAIFVLLVVAIVAAVLAIALAAFGNPSPILLKIAIVVFLIAVAALIYAHLQHPICAALGCDMLKSLVLT